eukprot:714978-Amphidinium_carterae.1
MSHFATPWRTVGRAYSEVLSRMHRGCVSPAWMQSMVVRLEFSHIDCTGKVERQHHPTKSSKTRSNSSQRVFTSMNNALNVCNITTRIETLEIKARRLRDDLKSRRFYMSLCDVGLMTVGTSACMCVSCKQRVE